MATMLRGDNASELSVATSMRSRREREALVAATVEGSARHTEVAVRDSGGPWLGRLEATIAERRERAVEAHRPRRAIAEFAGVDYSETVRTAIVHGAMP